MAENNTTGTNKKRLPLYIGAGLIIFGLIVLLSQYLKSILLLIAIIPATGVVFLLVGVRLHKAGYIIPGCILSGVGFGTFVALTHVGLEGLIERVGIGIVIFGLSWIILSVTLRIAVSKMIWWPFVPAGILLGIGIVFLFMQMRIIDFTLCIGIGLGLSFLLWGVFKRVFGLIIPGSVIISTGLGIYLGWNHPAGSNPLSQVGVMLVWFALGWGLIILFSRVVTERFMWWPLIPGGVLAVVGWGLYAGGNPSNAFGFISNTGSIGIILVGLYLILLRRGIHR